LRAGLVKDLRELDKYPWTGHAAILAKRNNPLMPNQPDRPNEPNKPNRPNQPNRRDRLDRPLAEKTLEDVLLHFGDTLKVARRRYRQFACAVKSTTSAKMQDKGDQWR
jgi:putative transposase